MTRVTFLASIVYGKYLIKLGKQHLPSMFYLAYKLTDHSKLMQVFTKHRIAADNLS